MKKYRRQNRDVVTLIFRDSEILYKNLVIAKNIISFTFCGLFLRSWNSVKKLAIIHDIFYKNISYAFSRIIFIILKLCVRKQNYCFAFIFLQFNAIYFLQFLYSILQICTIKKNIISFLFFLLFVRIIFCVSEILLK